MTTPLLLTEEIAVSDRPIDSASQVPASVSLVRRLTVLAVLLGVGLVLTLGLLIGSWSYQWILTKTAPGIDAETYVTACIQAGVCPPYPELQKHIREAGATASKPTASAPAPAPVPAPDPKGK